MPEQLPVFAAITYNCKGVPQVDFVYTEENAKKVLLAEAEGYLSDGAKPPHIDDWSVARVVGKIELGDDFCGRFQEVVYTRVDKT